METARGARILYVEQEPPLRGTTIREAVYTGIEPDPASAADTALRAAYAYHVASLRADTDPAAFELAASAAADCWDDDARARAICEVLGLSAILDKEVSDCSGGERKRAGLAAALARQPDALLLDEPTNHLDGRAVQWLASLLTTPASNREAPAVLCVSHDRFFLEQVCTDGLLELDRAALHRCARQLCRGFPRGCCGCSLASPGPVHPRPPPCPPSVPRDPDTPCASRPPSDPPKPPKPP